METQVCHYEPPTMADRRIKIERDEDDDDSCENSETDIPCISTVPFSADKNTGSYYYPSQAVVVPRTPVYTTVGKMAQKRKTVQALAQAALMTADEPILFEETIWCSNAKIALIDTKTKQVIARDHLRKNSNNSSTSPPQATDSTTTVNTTRDLSASSAPLSRVSKPCQLQRLGKVGSTAAHPETGETSLSSTSNSTASTFTTSNFPAKSTSASGVSSAVATTALSTPPVQNQLARHEAPTTTTTVPRPRTSLLNSLPSERARIEPTKGTLDKPPVKKTTYKPLAMAPYASVRPEMSSSSVRPETNSKMAVCLPNSASKTESSVARCVFVPREINLGAIELRLEDCINVKDICDKELTKWTAEDVAKFVRATDCSEYAHVFVDQEIDGKALTLLNQDFLIQWMKLKLGPAMKLNCHIINLKHSLNSS
ncbi:putative GPI-anchored protein pfl2 [Dendronephthya gigantea]|uniref:putative GPI-anchored protein pfl2 n=1 Tax=Dendronephthya gigantea TaxID=151771 RepID=UPI00106C64EC|nr:putative GPI-anchored protein pfl2 [Dendronephthya gigantea]